MFEAFGLLLASSLLPTMLFYVAGMLLIKKLRLSRLAQFAGFFVAVVFSAIISLLLAEEPTNNSALNEVIIGSIAGSIVAILVLCVAGRRKHEEMHHASENTLASGVGLDSTAPKEAKGEDRKATGYLLIIVLVLIVFAGSISYSFYQNRLDQRLFPEEKVEVIDTHTTEEENLDSTTEHELSEDCSSDGFLDPLAPERTPDCQAALDRCAWKAAQMPTETGVRAGIAICKRRYPLNL
jgi:hypothetical protein